MEDFNVSLCMFINNEVRSVYTISRIDVGEHNNVKEMEHPIPESFKKSNPNHLKYRTHILTIKPFVDELKSSPCYRNFVILNFKEKFNIKLTKKQIIEDNCKCFIFIEADLINSYVIDYTWGWMLWRDCHMGLERECAAAWLSTLGGAFSALGDYSSKFASRALQTSIQQLKLARMSHDDNGIARGLLFLALALSQLGFRSYSNMLLRRAKDHPSFDPRHRNMCLGVQAKLRCDQLMRSQMNKEEKSTLLLKRSNLWESIKHLTL